MQIVYLWSSIVTLKTEINLKRPEVPNSTLTYGCLAVDCSWLLHVLVFRAAWCFLVHAEETYHFQHKQSESREIRQWNKLSRQTEEGHQRSRPMLHLPHLHNWFSTVLMLESHMRKPERWTDGKRFHSGQLYNIHSFTIENYFNDFQKQTTITYMHHEYWKTNPKWQANRFYKYVRQDTPHASQSPIIPLVYWHTHGQNIPEHSCIRSRCTRNSISIKNTQARPAKMTNMICIGKYLAHFWTKKIKKI